MTTLRNATPEELIDAFLTKVLGDAYDPESEHFADTPRRFTQMMRELTNGSENWQFTTFTTHNREMLIERDIRFVSMCAHHLAPFYGVCHIGYIPEGKNVGISKLARLVRSTAHMATNQEELTSIIADQLLDRLDTEHVAVVMDATHSCMSIRGAMAHGTTTITSAMRGAFNDHTRTAKIEFLSFINAPKR